MQRIGQFMRTIALLMAVVMFATSLPITVSRAAMVPTDQVVEVEARAADRARVMEFMTREDVRRQFEELGIDPDEAAQRARSLSDDEIGQLAGRLDQLPAGQGAVGIIVGALLVIFLVLLITDLLGLTNVFSFVKAQN